MNILAFLTSFLAAFAFLKYIVLVEIRIDENNFKALYDDVRNQSKIILEEEFSHEKKYPIVFCAFCFTKKLHWFYLSHTERLLSAGFTEKDYVSNIIFLRHNYNKFKEYFINCKNNKEISVDLLMPYYSDKIGNIKKCADPIITNKLCEYLEKDISDRKKTSAIFYGKPGNGKTTFVKYLAQKYTLPIKIMTFNPEWSNQELLVLFSQIPNNCIVLLEDFDNYFDKRTCIIGGDNKNIKFTFDIILNALDGIYNTYENVIFIMTTNDLDKVDESLKNRPSRFKYVIEFFNPDEKIIKSILNISSSDVDKVLGMNLDQILTIKESYQSLGFEESIKKIHKS